MGRLAEKKNMWTHCSDLCQWLILTCLFHNLQFSPNEVLFRTALPSKKVAHLWCPGMVLLPRYPRFLTPPLPYLFLYFFGGREEVGARESFPLSYVSAVHLKLLYFIQRFEELLKISNSPETLKKGNGINAHDFIPFLSASSPAPPQDTPPWGPAAARWCL